ncbi:MAG: helix-turn-helix transcriptional regulator, partial [Desulfosporosinus sp.]
MKAINVGNIIAKKRTEKGITQEELAAYIGISKASVSKWETGQSYPDIVFLPELATYFNISLDTLLGYTPQMNKEDIKKIYLKLAKAFASKPFEDVFRECEEIIKKYYSCFPLLLQMSVLLLNHHNLVESKERQHQVIQQIILLCQRIRSESDEVDVLRLATTIEAICESSLGNPQNTLALLGETLNPYMGEDII